ncbi:peptide chain release factor 3 [Paludifilum halophilum]|uniref:Peptide chain release factor 3 n=1 Tax=Paludifilum halophilum TaxID=1642702 RepID=A0A235B9E3_9BACL|nr:peptide chain release factor 3 [Paludifilum halophilum]OYD08619.1 peptide chain release factor 3 [Paludifilum halophilum]
MKDELQTEVSRRRTFAIISHPDAGKTTLTEKLLLFGGAIREAGSVKGRKAKKHAASDWMDLEKQRGISVTSSVLEFTYRGYHVNILDTPGHQDFSEDTYRTLAAADSAVMLIDCAKGVEPQTIKLFEVCAKRGIPVFTFINKMDRHGKDPFDLLEEIESVLGMRSHPMNWPVGIGSEFCGIYNRHRSRLERFDRQKDARQLDVEGPDDPLIREEVGDLLADQLSEEIALLDIAGDPYDFEKIRNGELTPVFFGSAVTNFGVEAFLEDFLGLAPSPSPRESDQGLIQPEQPDFSGFVFKIQANMNPAHRDRVAFLRICSGKFERGMNVRHVRTGKNLKLAQPQQFMARDRSIVEEAYTGDIVGLFDPGQFRVGDTLCEKGSFQFEPLPKFPPEHFAKITNKNAMRYKQYQKGLEQLVEEGAIQKYRTFLSGPEEIIIGAVGELQFEVFDHRMKSEYGVDLIFERLPFRFARWVKGAVENPARLQQGRRTLCVKDDEEQLLVLFDSEFFMEHFIQQNRELTFAKQSD